MGSRASKHDNDYHAFSNDYVTTYVDDAPTVPEYPGWHPLHVASFYGNVDAVRNLIYGGAYVSAQDAMGRTALHYARARRNGAANDTVADLLIEAGAKDNGPRDKRGRTPNDVYFEYLNRAWPVQL